MDEKRCSRCKIVLPSKFLFCPMCGSEISPAPAVKQVVKRRPKGCGSVYQLSGQRSKPWVAKLRGKVLDYFPDRPTAEKFLAEQRDKNPALINTTLFGIYERYQKTQGYQRLSDGGRSNYALAWDKLEPIHKMLMRDIRSSHFQACVNAAHGKGCGHDGCAKIKTLSSLLCKEAMKDDIITHNYADGIELPTYVQKVKRRNISDEEVLTLMYADDDRDARIVLCMLYTATRISELFDIKKAAVNLDAHTMIGGAKSKVGTDRVIVIRDEIYSYVVDFMQEPGEYLFSSPTGRKINSDNFRSRNFYELLDRMGFDYKDENGNNLLTPHRTRHTYISESIMAGVKPEALRRLVGHANYSTSVDKYDDVVNVDFLKKEAKKGL